MIRVLLLQMRLVVPIMATLNVVGYALLYFFEMDLSVLLFLFSGMSVLFASVQLRRSEWYLSLPWSRSRIAVLVVSETLALSAIALTLNSLGYFAIRSLSTGFTLSPREFLYTTLWFTGVGVLATLANSLYGKPVNRNGLEWSRYRDQTFRLTIASVTGWLLGSYFWSLSMWVTSWLIVCAMLFGLCRSFVYQLVVPELSRRFVIRSLLASGLLAMLLPPVLAFYVIHWGRLDSGWTPRSFMFLDKLAGNLSAERALALFDSPQTPVSPAFEKFISETSETLDFERWEKRTRQCKSLACLDLSGEFAKLSRNDPSEIEKRFLVFIDICDFDVQIKQLVCKGLLPSEHTIHWMQEALALAGTFDVWLAGSDVTKQVLAIPYAAQALQKEHEDRLRVLEQSDNMRVRMMAEWFLAKGRLLSKNKIECYSARNRDHELCQPFRSVLVVGQGLERR